MFRVPALRSSAASLALLLPAAAVLAVPPPAAVVSLVSVNRTTGGSGNAGAGLSRVGPDGRHVVFSSKASNLVADDANGTSDVFVRDLDSGVTLLASMNAAGTGSGNGPSSDPQISYDGRYAVFESTASDLVPNDTNGAVMDVFVRDLLTGTTTLLSASINGGSGNGASFDAVICADGSTVAFESQATDLVAGDTNGKSDVFIRRQGLPNCLLVSTDSTGSVRANGTSWDPVMSQDGQVITFESTASNLVTNDHNGTEDVFVRNLATGATSLVSINLAGTGSADDTSMDPTISADGRRIEFKSWASDLVTTDSNGLRDIFVRDLPTNSTSLVTVNRFGSDSGNGDALHMSRICADGSAVVFTTTASDLVANDTNGDIEDVFVRRLDAGTTTLASVNMTGGSGNGASAVDVYPSEDARFVVFDSEASDLAPGDANGENDIFLRDVTAGTTTLVSANVAGTGSGNGFCFNPYVSRDGRTVSFDSSSSDLVARDGNGSQDVFAARFNAAPTAAPDAYTLLQNASLQVPAPGLLANDSDREGEPIGAVLVAGPTHGSLVLNADGSFAYTPAAGFAGTDSFTYQATDGLQTSPAATVTLTVKATLHADAGPDQTLDGTGVTTRVTLNGTASTVPAGAAGSYLWYEGTARIAGGVAPAVLLKVGTHTITLKLTAGGATATDVVVIKVVDHVAPVIGPITLSRANLSPANYQLKSVTVSYSLTDKCDPGPKVKLAAASSEPVTGTDKHDPSNVTTPDFAVLGPHSVVLRAEYLLTGSGRTYTLTVTATDASGNTASRSVTISVPKS